MLSDIDFSDMTSYDDCRKTKTMWIQLMINISNNMMLNIYIMYTHPHTKITDGAKMARLIIISNNIWILSKHTTSFYDEQNLREHPQRLERLKQQK
jgi:7-cyano-7-deazaguanine synthase in queuosine biosynthesis